MSTEGEGARGVWSRLHSILLIPTPMMDASSRRSSVGRRYMIPGAGLACPRTGAVESERGDTHYIGP